METILLRWTRYIVVSVLIVGVLLVSLPAPAEAPKATRPEYGDLLIKLQQYISTRPGDISVYVKDLASGETLDLNSDKVVVAASTIKMPLILYVYEQAALGNIDLETKLIYTPEYFAQGTGILQGEPFGKQYSIRELSRLSMEYSDNVAWKMLLSYIGQDKLTIYEKSLGAKATGGDNGLYITTPSDMGRYLERLLTFSDEHPEFGHEVLYYMQNSIFSEGIPQDLPEETIVAHKMGALNDKFHDVGIVFGKRPYIITIFTDNGWEEVSLKTLADISKMVYEFQNTLD
mgnify:CR=1 FL=1